ncbi:ABC transporter ATP-binding protein [Conexibacter arvalis]|uniref:Putative ABC transport system ATP-binding protein n=1 Tax=Conexibacter arvalis TaxID=912552 RepID=A0A840IJM1_9ACTN|nr:ABC transporter ATP-binding protein [Conexibacter arvalis]MBB4664224.1 putative ABC transport system ATP-binding protein [Conexibacter arvalis]
MLELDRVVKHYRSGGEVVRAVDDVTLTVAGGEMVALYGPSGSGKTTLLQLAAALLTPDAGSVRFDGRDVGAFGGDEADDYRRLDVGFVFQEIELWRGVSAQENAALKLVADPVPWKQARKQAARWLERVGLGHKLDEVPEHLSGGERQRVAIATALANEPRLILADEPTGSLDSRRGRDVLELLRAIARERGAAVLLVTHDPQAAEIADRVHTLRDGMLLSEAPEPPLPARRALDAAS